MDIHLFTKIVHMSAVSLLIIAFVLRGSTLFVGIQDQQPNPKARKGLVALQHLSLTLIIVTGAVLLFMNNFEVQPWFYAKVILFFVLWSSLIKTYKKDSHILLQQRRAGLLIGTVAMVGILGLVMIKPVFA
ncbi:invasion protein expression up-regulator SirB [Acinetobacter proteolyticus]|uniref:SirB2 family protein n=1 Tax=Acinetobacter proteolyticus TaxID=1776741 RepID=UPI0008631DBB|nr:SirB2 family protein [Acinetobacter proteolyticus]OEY91976.1 invasion protein expression up-regulator SirB [Acinetobacter proteolyticus]QHH95881.1 invasion protein expression up-regulator SirB [Acinetobacter gyllenbergii]